MAFSVKDKERLDLSISALKSIIEERVQHQKDVAEEILCSCVEAACSEHCKEEVL